MERTISLNGEWKLYFYEESKADIRTPEQLAVSGIAPIPASVPGNVELDLSRAGILPGDLYKGMNIVKAEKFESYSWWYETAFPTPEYDADTSVELHFAGTDCIAEYFLNGKLLGLLWVLRAYTITQWEATLKLRE